MVELTTGAQVSRLISQAFFRSCTHPRLVNTHRYTIWRYARKMRGRCFGKSHGQASTSYLACFADDASVSGQLSSETHRSRRNPCNRN